MKFKITKKIESCNMLIDCPLSIKNIQPKITDLIGTTDTNQYHISVCHAETHTIWLYLYDKTNIMSMKLKEET